VLARGNERRPVFRDGEDYGHFVELLGTFADRFHVGVLAYVLRGNHLHLVLRPQEENLSRAMQWLMVCYSVWHNRRHRRSGHLFQGRFKSVLATEAEYVARLICYVHRNPPRARLVERLAEYPWSSYRALAYGKNVPGWLSREEALKFYGGKAEAFRRAVQEYSGEKRKLWEDLRHGLFLGSEEGLKRLRRAIKLAAHREKPGSRGLARGMSVSEDVDRWRSVLGILSDEMARLCRPIRGRERPLRDALIHLVWKNGRHSLAEIGREFGMGYTGVVNARQRGARYLSERPALRRVIESGVK
jgi:REP element-mobilizing transposase RayT